MEEIQKVPFSHLLRLEPSGVKLKDEADLKVVGSDVT